MKTYFFMLDKSKLTKTAIKESIGLYCKDNPQDHWGYDADNRNILFFEFWSIEKRDSFAKEAFGIEFE